MNKKAYIVKLSNDVSIPIDEDEISKVIIGIENGQPILLRQGVIVNTNYIVAIVPDNDRVEEAITLGKKEIDILPDAFKQLRKKQLNEKKE